MKSQISNSYKYTQEIAQQYVKELKGGNIICLYGELGAGKTTFVQGLARGLGIKGRIISPTFIIVRKYNLDNNKTFYHIDLYRIEKEKDLEGLGIDEILSDKNAIVVIEWAERLGTKLPKDRTEIYFKNIDDHERQIIWK